VGQYFVSYSLGRESNLKLKEAFARLRTLADVATPVILRLYDCFDRAKT